MPPGVLDAPGTFDLTENVPALFYSRSQNGGGSIPSARRYT